MTKHASTSHQSHGRARPAPITARYLLLTFIPYYVDERGDVWLDRLWHRDFVEHLRYLACVTLAAPRRSIDEAPPDAVKLELPRGATLDFAPLPSMRSASDAITRLPALARTLWRATDDAVIVHSGVAGWPIPPGWIASTIALVRGRMLMHIVESAPWRLSGADDTARARVREVVTESLARFFVRRADLNIFTHGEYRRTLATPRTRGCHVTPASWINEDEILSEVDARTSWSIKRERPVRLLFAARLVASKGVEVLLDALRELDRDGVRARVDVIGEGPLRDACARAGEALTSVELRLLDPVAYGAPFFTVVRERHAVLVPNLGDEQPRIVFDAYAQAVPVIASDTDGIRPHVKDGETGWMVRAGSAADLARAIERATREPETLVEMGMHALAEAPRFTHRAMHEERWRILADALAARAA